MYLNFFGLTSWPFKTTPELKMFFKDGSRAEILEALAYTVARGDGIVKVTGEVGSGKTMLLRLLASKLPDTTEIIYINSPNLSAKDILLYICSELKIDISNFKEKFSLTNALKNRLVDLHSKGHKVVMLIDEAQVMTFDALEEIRLLSNIETGDDKLLQMVLFGQPELDVAMENDRIRQIKSRISYSIYVPPLSTVEVHSYLNYRMRQAGYKGLDVFNFKVAKRIHKLSGGLPRTINVLADKLLMACFGNDDRFVKKCHFNSLTEYNSGNVFSNKWFWFGSLLFSLIITLAILFEFFSPNFTQQSPTNNSTQNEESPAIGPDQSTLSSELVMEDQLIIDKPSINEQPIHGSTHQQESALVETMDVSNESIDDPEIENTVDQNTNSLNTNSLKEPISEKLDNDLYSENGLTEPFLALHRRGQLTPLLQKHRESTAWLLNQQNRYTIQLSTRNIASLEATYAFYRKSNFNLDNLHILIDFNQRVNVYRIKVFHSSSNSFSNMSSEIENLPERIKKEGPYVVRVESIKNKLNQTQMKLNNVGIINE